MKKSKYVSLVLITAALASCDKEDKRTGNWGEKKVYLRSDSSAGYSRSHHLGTALLWYYAFRPYGFMNGGRYQTGYYNRGISPLSNIGINSGKSAAIRGGFGRSSSISS